MNEIIEYDDYAEIILYDKYGNEKARAIIDLDDVDRCRDYRWSYDRYVRNISFVGMLHRFVMNCTDNMVVDHINGDTLDNRKSNLRICNISQNAMNQKTSTRNKSGHKGIFWEKSRNKWRATINIDKKQIMIGRYNTLEEAIQARRQAEIDYYGEYRRQE